MDTPRRRSLCKSDMMKRFYQGKNCFDQKEIDKYVHGSERSKKREYPMDWVFDFSYDPSEPAVTAATST